VPIALAKDGAYFFGLKIGRRSQSLCSIDFHGRVVARTHLTYRYPTPEGVVRFAARFDRPAVDQLDAGGRAERIAGLGVAMPFQIWEWARSSASPRRDGRLARHSTSGPRSRRSAPTPSTSRTTPRRPAGRSSSSERAIGPPISSTSTSATSSAAESSCATTSSRGGPATRAHSARCRCPSPDGGVVQLIDLASLSQLEARMRDGARTIGQPLARARRLARRSRGLSPPGPTARWGSPTPSQRRRRSSISRRCC
jgi:hypothetical protein